MSTNAAVTEAGAQQTRYVFGSSGGVATLCEPPVSALRAKVDGNPSRALSWSPVIILNMKWQVVPAVVALGLATACSSSTTAEPRVVTVTATEEEVTVVEEHAETVTETHTATPQGTSSPSSSSSQASTSNGSAPSGAMAALNNLQVKGRAPKTGYDRAMFGQAWSDDVSEQFGHNGCDTRNDILKRDLTGVTIKSGTNDCVILTGTLNDPFTGANISFTRGQGTSNAVQIDHVVSVPGTS